MKKLFVQFMFLSISITSMSSVKAENFLSFSQHAKAAVFSEEEACGTPKYAPHELKGQVD